ncbi:MAG: organoarsenical effux transporter ArsJ [Chloroflexota bacterium]|jgi:predicted MFS family arabinose efflux permease
MSPLRSSVAYSLFTLTDGAFRMMVLFQCVLLGYSTSDLALVFVLYELAGVVTNLYGGRAAARYGHAASMRIGLVLQTIAVACYVVGSQSTVIWVLFALQGAAGVAKDMVKIGAKSAVADSAAGAGMFRWIAAITGAKNATKGVGFFLGAALVSTIGAGWGAAVLAVVTLAALGVVFGGTEKPQPTTSKSRRRSWLSPITAVNRLAVARLFLFGAREVWLAIALPVWLSQYAGWDFWQSGAVMAGYTIGYGFIQAFTPRLLGGAQAPDGRFTALISLLPALVSGITFICFRTMPLSWVLITGVGVYSIAFAVTSALHSYLIGAYAQQGAVSRDIGIYYSANALGRLLGLLASGMVYAQWGMEGILLATLLAVLPAALIALPLPAPAGVVSIETGADS